MSKKIALPKPTVGYGYTGIWHTGQAGWFMPQFVYGSIDRKFPDDPIRKEDMPLLDGERLFLCKITIEPLVDKAGRPITKIVHDTENT